MFCSKCGKEIVGVSAICACGNVIKRPKSINTAAIISLISAVLSSIVGFFFILSLLILKTATDVPRTPSEKFIFEFGILVGLSTLLWGLIDFFVWFGLRRLQRWAGILGIAAASLVMVLAIFLGQLRDITILFVNILIMILISVGWKALK